MIKSLLPIIDDLESLNLVFFNDYLYEVIPKRHINLLS